VFLADLAHHYFLVVGVDTVFVEQSVNLGASFKAIGDWHFEIKHDQVEEDLRTLVEILID
jgi:tRNA(Phe) wybutosine-synthesizing methylase Tyw3